MNPASGEFSWRLPPLNDDVRAFKIDFHARVFHFDDVRPFQQQQTNHGASKIGHARGFCSAKGQRDQYGRGRGSLDSSFRKRLRPRLPFHRVADSMMKCLQLQFDFPGRLMAIIGPAGMKPRDEVRKFSGHGLVDFAERFRRAIANLADSPDDRRSFEGLPTRAHGVIHAAEAEMIAMLVDGFTARLLGRHVSRGAGDQPLLGGMRVIDCPGEAEVRDIDLFGLIFDENVLRHEVAMNEAPGMNGRQARRDLGREAKHEFDWLRPSR